MAAPAPGTATRPIHSLPVLGERGDDAWHPPMSHAAAQGTGTVLCGDADAYAGTALREANTAGFTPREVAVLL